MANDWFRKITWTKEDEKDFFSRLNKARGNKKPQYLRIQAITLYETRNHKYFNVAINLLNKILNEYPDNIFEKIMSFKILGDIYYKMKKYDTALENYYNAIEFEGKDQYVKTEAYINYSLMVIQLNKIELFDKVELLLLNEIKTGRIFFPIQKYKINAILSIIYKHKNELEKANDYKAMAEEAANAEFSDFRWHKKLGLVEKRNKILDKLMKSVK
jgi:tetratricopeptide (TPR) repeat protein